MLAVIGLRDSVQAGLFDLDGKPRYDGVRSFPTGEAPVLEDALAGVDRAGQAEVLSESGASVVLSDLSELLEE